MFLVDDDQAEPGRGGENGTAGADNDPDPSRGDLAPLRMPLDGGEMAVEDRHGAEAAAEAVAGLGGEADFGDKDDRLTPLGEGLLDRLEIDLRLPAPRYPEEKNGLVAALPQRRENRVERALLGGGELTGAMMREGRPRRGPLRLALPCPGVDEETGFDEPADHRAATLC